MTALAIHNIKFDTPTANHWIRGHRGGMGLIRDWFDPGAAGHCPGQIRVLIEFVDGRQCSTCYRTATSAADGVDRWAKVTTLQDIDGEYDFTEQHPDSGSGVVVQTDSSDIGGENKNGEVRCVWERNFTAATTFAEATEYSDSFCSTPTGNSYTWDRMKFQAEANSSRSTFFARIKLTDSTGNNPSHSQSLTDIVLLQTQILNNVPALGWRYLPDAECRDDGTSGSLVSGASVSGIIGNDIHITGTIPTVGPAAIFYRPGSAIKRFAARLGIATCGGCEKRARWLDDRAEDVRRFFNGLRGQPA